MTNMHFPFGNEADLIGKLLANYHYRAVVNHRDQWYFQTKMVWRGQLVYCRLGCLGLTRLPGDLYSEIWCGYYDINEPDSMLYDEVHPNIFACIKQNHLADAA